MADKPIIFSAPMVNAISAGRKTQTRRVIKPQPPVKIYNDGANRWYPSGVWGGKDWFAPYQVGDTLWVRETWCPANSENGPVVCYKADLARCYLVDESYPVDYALFPAGRNAWTCWASDLESGVEGAWRPSIFMPHWASRITLRVTNVRAQRAQDISEDDAAAEGIERHSGPYILDFAKLWDSINGKKHPWNSNPFVWAYTFEVTA
jgi:hypothetical protein